MLIMDGLGGLAREPGGRTELETARTPNLDALAFRSALGLSQPAGPGITVGSGPGHLAVFGYDPIRFPIGRGALEALGVDFELGPRDLAARGNFCSLDDQGLLLDRRAGRIPSETGQELINRLNTIRVEGAEFEARLVKEHRFALVMRSSEPGDSLTDTDPLTVGVAPLPVKPRNSESAGAAELLNRYLEKARDLLKDQRPANMIMLRGFARLPEVPSYGELFGLRAAAISLNGMYRGVARMAGMQVLPVGEKTLSGEFDTLARHWNDFDFFYIHIKQTDTCGENGDFEGKAAVIQEVDSLIPRMLELDPQVVIVSGDHSSPAVLKSHSWHPVPTLLYARNVRADGIGEFGEQACARGSLGVLPATHIMPIALANAGRIAKYGA